MIDAQTVLTNFGTIAEAPGGVTRLRELILDFAVRGKLVPQDSADEPGTHFIKRVRQERLRRLATGKERGLDSAEGLTVEPPYALPEGWTWANFGAACINRDAERVPLRSSDRAARQGEYDYYGASGVIDKIDDYLFDGEMLLIGEDGANLTNRSTPIAFIASGRFWVNNHAHVIDSLSSAALRYLAIYVNSIDLKPYLTGIAQPKLNQKRLNRIPIPIPPEAEQSRIVAKVDELMRLCDEFETRQHASNEILVGLRSSSFAALTSAETNRDFRVAWSRIDNNWESLLDHSDGVDALRNLVLHLAVRGRLVAQQPNEEPAAVLLDAIATQRRGLVENGLIKKPKPLSVPSEAFALPPGWQWARLGSLCIELSYGTAKKCEPAPASGVPVLRIPNIRTETGELSLSDLKYTELSEAEVAKYALSRGDLLIIRSNGSTRLVGRAIVVPELGAGLAYAGYLMRCRLIGVSPHYVRLVLESPWIRGQIEGPIRTTSGVKNVNSKEILSLEIPVPPLAEQHRIAERTEQLDQECRHLAASLQALDSEQRKLAAGIARSS